MREAEPLTSQPSRPSTSTGTLSRESLARSSISIMPRTIEPFILEALDAVPAASLPRLRLTDSLDEISQELGRELAAAGFGPDWLSHWITDDTVFLGRLFTDLTQARRLLVRLERIEDDACRRFHMDNVRYRLVTTYRGPGTQWIAPEVLAAQPPGMPLPDTAVRQLDRGSVAVMRGGKNATPERPGLLHRSPPIADTGVSRLFLAIDDAADHEH